MTTTETRHPKAETGRRVTYEFYNARKPHPGVITFATQGTVWVRLDGQRSSMQMPINQKGLTYLDEIGPVPELPMGRFQPNLQHPGIDWQYDGVIVVRFEEGDLAALTGDRAKAEAAVATFLREQDGIEDESDLSDELAELKPQWAVFEWEPEDAECAWLMNYATENDDQALQVHYLPSPGL
ncbi:hypothetical protein [Streptomyces sp. NPDC088736]|uniref:hypothetical protein n=1 Tax=Streptomyces sp. NPDC088736 TaxID=3365881 RepID=UPI00381993A4